MKSISNERHWSPIRLYYNQLHTNISMQNLKETTVQKHCINAKSPICPADQSNYSIAYSHYFPKLLKLNLSQWLCKRIYNYDVCRSVFSLDNAIFNPFPHIVVLDIDMLHKRLILWIPR